MHVAAVSCAPANLNYEANIQRHIPTLIGSKPDSCALDGKCGAKGAGPPSPFHDMARWSADVR